MLQIEGVLISAFSFDLSAWHS